MTKKILDELIEKGVASDVIIAVAKLMADAECTERLRAGARERMRRVRERSRTLRNGSEQLTASYLERKKESKKEEERERVARKRAPALKVPIPENWTPEEEINPSEFLELEKMRDWAKANAIRKADWSATWRNWKRRAPEFRKNQGQINGRRAGSILDAADKLINRLDEAGVGEYTPGSSGPKPIEVDSGPSTSGPRLISSR